MDVNVQFIWKKKEKKTITSVKLSNSAPADLKVFFLRHHVKWLSPPDGRRSVVDNNIDNFRWHAQDQIAKIAQVIWWRVADLQVQWRSLQVAFTGTVTVVTGNVFRYSDSRYR